ncbi:MAG: hypothetical protein Q7S44_01265 [bacterium]|nr:hypothetical protein [bacterium]
MPHLNLILVFTITLVLLSTFYALQASNQLKNTDSQNTPTPTPTSSNNRKFSPPQGNYSSDFVYPHATPTPDFSSFKSSDDTTAITNWYREKIKSLGMSTTSFVQTNTNGNVLNKLVGSDGQKEIEVEISKKSSSKEAKIVLNVN